MNRPSDVIKAKVILKRGGIVAYPTEAVFGLGCDPFQKAAVEKLLLLKGRAQSKGLILLASNWKQVNCLVEDVPAEVLQKVFSTWPGPITWVFPANANTPFWLCGEHKSIALRVTAHPLASALCRAFNGPIVSTSANRAGGMPARNKLEVQEQFPQGLDYILNGEVGGLAKPTTICDAMTGKSIR